MDSSTERHRVRHHPHHHITNFIQSAATNISTFISGKTSSLTATTISNPSKKIFVPLPLLVADSPRQLPPPFSVSSLFDSAENDGSLSAGASPTVRSVSSESGGSGFPSTVRISGLNSAGKGGGPAFVGQVFSMCDLSGTGLMAVSTHFDIPFISKRTPEWLKKMFQAVTKSERKGPVFHFFMDLGDAVSYVKRLNIPSGVVGACRLDLAYEHFKEKPHLFQFIPNERQVKEANKLLKRMPQIAQKRVDGVPVFSAQNLDIAIATSDGIKWYTPYFFDKNMLDNILEDSVDQNFHSLIQTRHIHRRRDIIDDNLAADILEENMENVWEPPEVQEVLDEIGNPGIPMSVISKAAEIQLLYAVDRVILGNRWLRKATGIQPKFPYVVDSFEKRSAASFTRASRLSGFVGNHELGSGSEQLQHFNPSDVESNDHIQCEHGQRPDSRFPFGDWFANPGLNPLQKHSTSDERKGSGSKGSSKEEIPPSPFLPKITMVGVSTGDAGQMSKAALKKTMDDLTRELERTDQGNMPGNGSEHNYEDRDPLFVANVGDYYSGASKTGSSRWVRPRAHRG